MPVTSRHFGAGSTAGRRWGWEGSGSWCSSQNHDQVGNRATGDRITDSVPIGRAMIGAALVLLGPFVPLLFQGEEWAASAPFRYFTDHQDPELGAAVSNGRRREFSSFGWSPEQVPDPQDPETFLASKLEWGEQSSAPHVLMLDWYRSLINLRRSIPTLTDGRRDRVRTSFDEQRRWLVVERARITIAANLGGEMVALPIDGRNEVVAASHQGIRFESGQIDLPPDSVAVLIG